MFFSKFKYQINVPSNDKSKTHETFDVKLTNPLSIGDTIYILNDRAKGRFVIEEIVHFLNNGASVVYAKYVKP